MKKKTIVITILIILVIAIIGGIYINKKFQDEKRKYEIEDVSDYKYFVIKENDKYGVIDKQGKKIIEPKYNDVKIPNPNKPVFFCYEEENVIVLNDSSKEIFTEYDRVEPLRLKNISSDLMYEKSVLKYNKDGKYGIIDFQGKAITNAIYDEIDTLQFKEGELIVKKQNKYGIINIKGAQLVKTDYDKIESDKYYDKNVGYKNSGYIVSNTTDEGYRYGYVKLNGKEILNVEYNEVYRIIEINSEDIYLICANNGKYGLVKDNKKIIENEYQSLSYNENNILVALKGKKYGVISMEGNVIVPFEYKQIDINGKNIYATSDNETVKIFNIKGEEQNVDKNIVESYIDNTNYKISIKTEENKTSYSIYENDKQKTKNDYTYIEYLHENYFIALNSQGKLGIINNNEETKVDFNYSSIQKIDDTEMIQAINSNTKTTEIYTKDMQKIIEMTNANVENKDEYIIVYNDKDIKYISKDGKILENTEIFKNNKIFAKKQGDLWGFVDINGNEVTEFKYENVTEVNEYGYAGIQQNGKWGVINNEGKVILEPTYDLNSVKKPTFINIYYQIVYGNGEIYYTNSK